MSTSILDATNGEGVYLTRFRDGQEFGYEITDQDSNWVRLTERQLDLLAAHYQMFRVEHSGMSTEFKNPETPEEWQECVDSAQFCLALDSCKQYGLVAGGSTVNMERCEQILTRAKELGYAPAPMEELCKRFIG